MIYDHRAALFPLHPVQISRTIAGRMHELPPRKSGGIAVAGHPRPYYICRGTERSEKPGWEIGVYPYSSIHPVSIPLKVHSLRKRSGDGMDDTILTFPIPVDIKAGRKKFKSYPQTEGEILQLVSNLLII